MLSNHYSGFTTTHFGTNGHLFSDPEENPFPETNYLAKPVKGAGINGVGMSGTDAYHDQEGTIRPGGRFTPKSVAIETVKTFWQVLTG